MSQGSGVVFEDWPKWREEYRIWLSKELGIDDVYDYIEWIVDYEEDAESKAENKEVDLALEEMGIHGFERPTVHYEAQNVAVVNINPRAELEPNGVDDWRNSFPNNEIWEEFTESEITDWREYARINDLDYDINFDFGTTEPNDPEAIASEGMEKGLKYLNCKCDEDYISAIKEGLAAGGFIDDAGEPLTENEVYYTNWFKYGTPRADDIPDVDDDSTPNEVLKEELELVDPDVIISFGGLPWDNFFKEEVGKSVSDGIKSDDMSDNIGCVFNYKIHNKPIPIIPLYFPKGRGVSNFNRHCDFDYAGITERMEKGFRQMDIL
jgi:hypothetical protein